MTSWTMADLERWDERIRERVEAYGLDVYPQEFEVCDQDAMLGYMAYHGMPSHYPHWSYGKAYEQTKTLYGYGVQGLPYEMVINSDPCLAYLMRDNSLCLQVLTIAHVYGHNDFFKNNFGFKEGTRAGDTISAFKRRAERVRTYIEDPSIGPDLVEAFLDAAHALSLSRSRQPVDPQARARGTESPRIGSGPAVQGPLRAIAHARGSSGGRHLARGRWNPTPIFSCSSAITVPTWRNGSAIF